MEKTKNFLVKSLFTVFLLFTAGLVGAQVAYAAAAGTVTFATGDASIVRADKSVVKAVKNDAVNVGDAIETKNGRLQLSLIDGGKVSLQPNTIYKINKYEFSGKEDGSEYAFTELVKGGMRTISGLIGHKNRDRYQLKTAVATIGIRGTEFTVNFNDNQLLMTTNHGSVDVCNSGGCLNAVTGQTIAVSGVGAAPKPSSKAAKAAAAAPASNKAVFAAGEEVVAINPTPAASLANYKGEAYASIVMKTANGNGVDGVLALENLETNANSQPIDMNTAGNAIDIHPNLAFSTYNSDGLVAWGRTYGGTVEIAGISNVDNSGPGNNNGGVTSPTTLDTMQWMDYAVGTRPDPTQIANLTGTYNVFGSTAPMLVTSGGTSTTIGLENTVTGPFTFNFNTANYNYNLVVATVGADYNLSGSGSALNAANPTFQTGGTVTGAACSGGACSGAFQGGNLIQGAFFGPAGQRIGLQYGFNAPTGQIYGTAVLK
jgi:FecR protein